MKLWVDDLREPPNNQWTWAVNSTQAIWYLSAHMWDKLSLDHDLGGDDTTRPVILWLCEHPACWPKRVLVHTANPVGREWLEGMIARYGT